MKTIIKKWLGIDRFEECKECGVLCHRNKMKKIKAYILYVRRNKKILREKSKCQRAKE